MRTLKILLVLFAVIFSGFSKDSMSSKAKVTVPFKFDGVIITNPSENTVCTPVGAPYPYIAHSRNGWLQGNQSHGGRLITEQSTWTIFNCHTDFGTKINTSYIEGENTVANRDSYSYCCTMFTNIATGEVILNITVTGGTGRFEDATGQATLSGFHTESGIPISGWGSLTIPK